MEEEALGRLRTQSVGEGRARARLIIKGKQHLRRISFKLDGKHRYLIHSALSQELYLNSLTNLPAGWSKRWRQRQADCAL